MPIYEYRCASCGHQQEVLQKVSDAPLTVCPKCGKPELAKMLTAAGFQLKGSGWYVTDFRNKGTSSSAKTESKPEAGDKAADKPASDGKTDSGGKTDGGGKSDGGGNSGAACGSGGCAACS